MYLTVILLLSSFVFLVSNNLSLILSFFTVCLFPIKVVRALVPMMTLDALFEQKGEVAKSVLEELEKVTCCSFIISFFVCLIFSLALFETHIFSKSFSLLMVCEIPHVFLS